MGPFVEMWYGFRVVPPGKKTWNMAAMGTVNASLYQWFRGYFPEK
jgi:hypothetical protein